MRKLFYVLAQHLQVQVVQGHGFYEVHCFAGTVTDVNLYQTAEALSEAVLKVPAIYDTLASAYVEAVLGQLTLNTSASVDVASVALAALQFAQQPQVVQVCLTQSLALYTALYSTCSLLHVISGTSCHLACRPRLHKLLRMDWQTQQP